MYSAGSVDVLTNYFDEQRSAFENIVPTLKAKQAGAARGELLSFRGIRGIKQMLGELLNSTQKNYATMGSGKPSLMLGEAWWINFNQKRVAKNVPVRLLFNDSLRKWSAATKYELAEVRYTDGGFEPLTETIIAGNAVGIIVWTEEPFGIILHSPTAAKSYLAYFDTLWKTAAKK